MGFSAVKRYLFTALQKATTAKKTGLITDTSNEQPVIYNVDCKQFMLNGREHLLYVYKEVTDEVSRKESDMCKQVIQLINHEIKNSIAPISSLTRSAKKIVKQTGTGIGVTLCNCMLSSHESKLHLVNGKMAVCQLVLV